MAGRLGFGRYFYYYAYCFRSRRQAGTEARRDATRIGVRARKRATPRRSYLSSAIGQVLPEDRSPQRISSPVTVYTDYTVTAGNCNAGGVFEQRAEERSDRIDLNELPALLVR